MTSERRSDLRFVVIVAVSAFVGAPLMGVAGVSMWVPAALVAAGVVAVTAGAWVARRGGATTGTTRDGDGPNPENG